MRAVEGAAQGRDPAGVDEPHFLEVRAGRTAFDAPESAQRMAAGPVMLANEATQPGEHGDLLCFNRMYEGAPARFHHQIVKKHQEGGTSTDTAVCGRARPARPRAP
ncbi:MAG TPA: hypothetical protein VFO85_15675 [Vicinamibacteria bacterium]|nr:hypothetical protein [Vicinamibacteria bacterium]